VNVDSGLSFGKLATIWLDPGGWTIGNEELFSVTTGLLPKFCPLMVSIPVEEFTVVLSTSGIPDAYAGELTIPNRPKSPRRGPLNRFIALLPSVMSQLAIRFFIALPSIEPPHSTRSNPLSREHGTRQKRFEAQQPVTARDICPMCHTVLLVDDDLRLRASLAQVIRGIVDSACGHVLAAEQLLPCWEPHLETLLLFLAALYGIHIVI